MDGLGNMKLRVSSWITIPSSVADSLFLWERERVGVRA
jgi:hypothetical protein